MFDDQTGFFTPEAVEGNLRPKVLARGQDLKKVLN